MNSRAENEQVGGDHTVTAAFGAWQPHSQAISVTLACLRGASLCTSSRARLSPLLHAQISLRFTCCLYIHMHLFICFSHLTVSPLREGNLPFYFCLSKVPGKESAHHGSSVIISDLFSNSRSLGHYGF